MIGLQVTNYNNAYMIVDLILDDVEVATAFGDGSSSYENNQSGVTVVVECAKDQRVWVKSMTSDNHMMAGYKSNVFTGFLLVEM